MHIKSDAETADSTYNGTFTNGHASSEPVAIVGMSCRLAGGVTNPKQLWELMCQERDCWSKFPTSRFDGETLYHADQERIDRVSIGITLAALTMELTCLCSIIPRAAISLRVIHTNSMLSSST